MTMPTATAMPQPVGTRAAGLVSVDGRTYPLESARLEGRAEGGIAVVTLTQTYHNPYQEPLEVQYTLPLPADGAVIGYTVRMGEKVIRGEVEPREKAEADYRKAIAEGRTAGLLEQDRADTFQQRLGALPPGVKAEVAIEILQPLAFLPASDDTEAGRGPSDGCVSGVAGDRERESGAGGCPRWELRFPTVVGVRYEGAPDRVPDADRLDVDRGAEGTPARMHLGILIADGPTDGLRIESPSGEVVLTPEDVGTLVGLRTPARLDRDLVLRWTAARPEVGVRVVEGTGLPEAGARPEASGDTGRYALVTVTPPALVDRYLSRDLTILIDASGSMHGLPIHGARRLAQELLRSLDPGDRFDVIAFANRPQRLTGRTRKATPRSVRLACEQLEELDAGGATEMLSGIRETLRPLRDDAQRQVVLVTDGYIGFEAEVIGAVMRELPAGSRVHAVGIGSAPNRTLTRGVARAGRGAEAFVRDEEELDAAVGRLRQATARPVLTGVAIEGSAVAQVDVERARDVMAGQPLVATVELRPEGGELVLTGSLAGSREPWVQRLAVPARGTSSDSGRMPADGLQSSELPLGALHGRERIEEVELRIAARGESTPPLESEIERLGMRHRIASRRTSLVAVADEPSVDPRQPRRREKLAVEMPADVSAVGVGLGGAGLMLGTRGLADGALLRSVVPARLMARFQTLGDVGMDLADVAGPSEDEDFAEFGPSAEAPPDRLVTPAQVEALGEADIVRVDGPLLILEFRVLHDGFEIPEGAVQVRLPGRRSLRATVDPDASSPRGPHASGLIVRLALRLDRGKSWSAVRGNLSWKATPGGEPTRYELSVTVPPAGGGSRC
jgi:Ca-activated chloride channel family protein